MHRDGRDTAGPPTEAWAQAAGPALEAALAGLWLRGWCPADVDRVVARRGSAVQRAVLRAALSAQAAGYAELGRRAAPAWMAQLDECGAAPRGTPPPTYLLGTVPAQARQHLPREAAALLRELEHLPPLPAVTPGPAEWVAGGVPHADLPPSVLAKVRALLAKAESTTFDAEAETFTAKAQELMTRHRIERARVAAEPAATGEAALARRVATDDPYAGTKAMLLSSVGRANGAVVVWSRDLGFATVFGFADELDVVEELFTSLLVQAAAALGRAGSKVDAAGRSRTARFRRSFLIAYAVRIGERLEEAARGVVGTEEAATGTALVPLLEARAQAARHAAARAFPRTRRIGASASDREGWAAGQAFGDRADLGVAPRLPPARRRPA